MITAPADLCDAVARWLADDCALVGGDVPFFAEMHADTRARYRLAAADLLNGPLAEPLTALQRVRDLCGSWRDSGEDPRLWIALRCALDGDRPDVQGRAS